MHAVFLAGGTAVVSIVGTLFLTGTLKDMSTATKWVAAAAVVYYGAPLAKQVMK